MISNFVIFGFSGGVFAIFPRPINSEEVFPKPSQHFFALLDRSDHQILESAIPWFETLKPPIHLMSSSDSPLRESETSVFIADLLTDNLDGVLNTVESPIPSPDREVESATPVVPSQELVLMKHGICYQ